LNDEGSLIQMAANDNSQQNIAKLKAALKQGKAAEKKFEAITKQLQDLKKQSEQLKKK
jgi:hypothetical protein